MILRAAIVTICAHAQIVRGVQTPPTHRLGGRSFITRATRDDGGGGCWCCTVRELRYVLHILLHLQRRQGMHARSIS